MESILDRGRDFAQTSSGQPSVVAARVANILDALYFSPREGAQKKFEPGTGTSVKVASVRMLDRLGLTTGAFGKKWQRIASGVKEHARRICARRPKCVACPLVSFCVTGQRAVANEVKPVVVDLFGGAGGLGIGFSRVGFRVALAVEIDPDAAQTYRFNNPGTSVLEADLTAISARTIAKLVRTRVNVLCAGPPCQSFSAAGSREKNDPRHLLFRNVLDIARDLNPDVVLIENVPGIARILKARQSYKEIIAEELGRNYEVEVLLLNAADYGVPQLRNRYMFIGRRRGSSEIGIPSRTHTATGSHDLPRTPSVTESLRAIPRRLNGSKKDWHRCADGTYLRNLTTMAHSAKVVRKIAAIRGGEGPISYRRVPPTLARTLISGHRALPVHPRLHRAMSVREAACIQAFPLDYVFLGTPANQPLQVANAVPPPMASAVAKEIMIHIRKMETPG
jgi:DNA (cytosine-5)-methyltransferase 1